MTQAKRQIERFARYIALVEDDNLDDAQTQLTQKDWDYVQTAREGLKLEDDDPQCAHCGWFRSEHAMSGCTHGFETEASFQASMKAYASRPWDPEYDL